MAAHRMAGDRPGGPCRPGTRAATSAGSSSVDIASTCGKFAAHGSCGRIDIEARALAEIIGLDRRARPSPRGLVSGATKIRPSSAQAARYSPFSVTLAWVQVRPDRYQTTGSFAAAPPAAAGRSRRSCRSPVAADAWRDDQLPPAVRLGSRRTISMAHCSAAVQPAQLVAVGIAQIGEVELAEAHSRDSRADPRSRCRRPRRRAWCQASTSSGLSKLKPIVAAVGMASPAAPSIGLRDHEHRAVAAVGEAALVIASWPSLPNSAS